MQFYYSLQNKCFVAMVSMKMFGSKFDFRSSFLSIHCIRKLITGFMLTNYVSIIPKVVSCS